MLQFTSVKAVLIIALMAQACRGVHSSTEVKLVGGEHARQGQFPSVMIWTDAGTELAASYCTGTKVGERFMLTAAHCVLRQEVSPGQEYLGPWRRVPALTPGQNKIRFSTAQTIDGSARQFLLDLKKVHWHPHVEKCLSTPDAQAGLACTYRAPLPDIAILEVNPGPNSPFIALPVAKISDDVVRANDAITMLGYGSERVNSQEPPELKYFPTTVATREAMRDALAGTEADRDGFPDFNLFFGTLGTLTGPGRANLGSGDSGGPVFRVADSAVVGVNSDGFCPLNRSGCQRTSNSLFARLDNGEPHNPYKWIKEVLAE